MIAAEGLRAEVEELYYAYAAAIDDDLDRWPEFFTPDAIYSIVARENFQRKLPLALVLAEGRGMMADRITAIRQTMVYQPRAYRHLVTNVRILGNDADGIRAGAHFAVYESLALAPSRLLVVGRYLDRIVRSEHGLRFTEKTCVYDGDVVQSSIVYPI